MAQQQDAHVKAREDYLKGEKLRKELLQEVEAQKIHQQAQIFKKKQEAKVKTKAPTKTRKFKYQTTGRVPFSPPKGSFSSAKLMSNIKKSMRPQRPKNEAQIINARTRLLKQQEKNMRQQLAIRRARLSAPMNDDPRFQSSEAENHFLMSEDPREQMALEREMALANRQQEFQNYPKSSKLSRIRNGMAMLRNRLGSGSYGTYANGNAPTPFSQGQGSMFNKQQFRPPKKSLVSQNFQLLGKSSILQNKQRMTKNHLF